MIKLGEVHPSPSVVMMRRGWHSSFVTITTLLGTKLELIGMRYGNDEDLKIRECRDWMVRSGDPRPSNQTPKNWMVMRRCRD